MGNATLSLRSNVARSGPGSPVGIPHVVELLSWEIRAKTRMYVSYTGDGCGHRTSYGVNALSRSESTALSMQLERERARAPRHGPSRRCQGAAEVIVALFADAL